MIECAGDMEPSTFKESFGYGVDTWKAKYHNINVFAPPKVLKPVSAIVAAAIDIADYKGKRPVNIIMISSQGSAHKHGGGFCINRNQGDAIIIFAPAVIIGNIAKSNWKKNLCKSLGAIAEILFHEIHHHRGGRGPKYLPKDKYDNIIEAYFDYLEIILNEG